MSDLFSSFIHSYYLYMCFLCIELSLFIIYATYHILEYTLLDQFYFTHQCKKNFFYLFFSCLHPLVYFYICAYRDSSVPDSSLCISPTLLLPHQQLNDEAPILNPGFLSSIGNPLHTSAHNVHDRDTAESTAKASENSSRPTDNIKTKGSQSSDKDRNTGSQSLNTAIISTEYTTSQTSTNRTQELRSHSNDSINNIASMNRGKVNSDISCEIKAHTTIGTSQTCTQESISLLCCNINTQVDASDILKRVLPSDDPFATDNDKSQFKDDVLKELEKVNTLTVSTRSNGRKKRKMQTAQQQAEIENIEPSVKDDTKKAEKSLNSPMPGSRMMFSSSESGTTTKSRIAASTIVLEGSSNLSHNINQSSCSRKSNRFKRIRSFCNSDSSSDDEGIKKKPNFAKEVRIDLASASTSDQLDPDRKEMCGAKEKSSEEMRLDKFDDGLFEYFGFDQANTSLILDSDRHPISDIDGLKSSDKNVDINTSFDELPQLNNITSQTAEPIETFDIISIPLSGDEDDEEIPGTAEVVKNVFIDIAKIRNMRRNIKKEKLEKSENRDEQFSSQDTIVLSSTQGSIVGPSNLDSDLDSDLDTKCHEVQHREQGPPSSKKHDDNKNKPVAAATPPPARIDATTLGDDIPVPSAAAAILDTDANSLVNNNEAKRRLDSLSERNSGSIAVDCQTPVRFANSSACNTTANSYATPSNDRTEARQTTNNKNNNNMDVTTESQTGTLST